ncbi:MAG TPA: catalase [Acidiphilium sp.]|nr:MAG: hypothetical protein B7Z67_09145 [Acidiphilium sp. 21-60-14]OYV89827.1 MAG: hypothetical protein B7Z57_11045 [Acidiphilium sp. 37-60-79]HQT90069.1 catalase [Acidiphilium sp.]HQU24682.1 catalase [Acidiphilium sp.]
MGEATIAQRLVEAVRSDFPDHQPGTRPVHTVGIGVSGTFMASEVAGQFCIAAPFRAAQMPVLVRFSNGSGSPVEHDGWSDVRGMATRFLPGDGAAMDMLAMTLPEFFTPNVDAFLQFTKAAMPQSVERESPWRKLIDMLRLELPLPDPEPGETMNGSAGMMAYANRHGFAGEAVFRAGMIGAPVSYARATYHAVHCFIVTGADGVRRPVRFSWQPVSGVRTTDPTAPAIDRYLHEELRARLAQGSAQFMLMMSVGEGGDALNDPTRPWPAKRTRVAMGMLSLAQVVADQLADCERVGFNPCRLLPGIAVSDDPILRARRDAYEYSQRERGATPCPFAGG